MIDYIVDFFKYFICFFFYCIPYLFLVFIFFAGIDDILFNGKHRKKITDKFYKY